MSERKLAIVLAVTSAVFLGAMVIIGLTTGATQELHEHYALPNVYKKQLLATPGALRAVFAFDIAFIAAYTGFFVLFARDLHARGAKLAYYALGAMLVVAVLDIIEDHHILALLDAAEHGTVPNVEQIAWQSAESAVKFSVSYVSLFLFGLCIPRDTKLGVVLAAFLAIGTLATAILGYAAPPAWRASLDSGRWIGFAIGFALAIAWLVRAPDIAATPTRETA